MRAESGQKPGFFSRLGGLFKSDNYVKEQISIPKWKEKEAEAEKGGVDPEGGVVGPPPYSGGPGPSGPPVPPTGSPPGTPDGPPVNPSDPPPGTPSDAAGAPDSNPPGPAGGAPPGPAGNLPVSPASSIYHSDDEEHYDSQSKEASGSIYQSHEKTDKKGARFGKSPKKRKKKDEKILKRSKTPMHRGRRSPS